MIFKVENKDLQNWKLYDNIDKVTVIEKPIIYVNGEKSEIPLEYHHHDCNEYSFGLKIYSRNQTDFDYIITDLLIIDQKEIDEMKDKDSVDLLSSLKLIILRFNVGSNKQEMSIVFPEGWAFLMNDEGKTIERL
jgi:hypothetical protein